MKDDFPPGPLGRLAVRMLLASGLRKYVQNGGANSVNPGAWETALGMLQPIEAAIVVLRVLHDWNETRIATYLEYKDRRNVNNFWARAKRIMSESTTLRRMLRDFETHAEPKRRNKPRSDLS